MNTQNPSCWNGGSKVQAAVNVYNVDDNVDCSPVRPSSVETRWHLPSDYNVDLALACDSRGAAFFGIAKVDHVIAEGVYTPPMPDSIPSS